MTGGLVQIVTYGAEDIVLTGQPQITFFKIVYRRHTNFAIEFFKQNFIGDINFGKEFAYKILYPIVNLITIGIMCIFLLTSHRNNQKYVYFIVLMTLLSLFNLVALFSENLYLNIENSINVKNNIHIQTKYNSIEKIQV